MGTTPAPDPGRRAFLAIAVAAPLPLLAACTGGPSTTPTGGPDDPDAALRDAVAEDERALIAAYDRVMAVRPDLADRLTTARDQHRAHLVAVSGDEAAAASASAGSATGTTATGPAAADVATLARLERRAADRRTRACRDSSSTDLARLLALIGASEAGHAADLRGLS